MKIYDALQSRNWPLSASARPRLWPGRPARQVRLRRDELVNLYQTATAMLPEGAPRILQLISATPGEGTSTIARELSLAVAEATGRRVLLLGISASGGRSSDAAEPGLEAVLSGDANVDDVLSKPGDAPLFVASLSATSAARQELFASEQFGELLKQLMTKVDVVIVDAPPVLADFAGLTLVRTVGGVILVVEAERTRSPIVNEAKRLIEANGGRILGVVLNKRRRHIPGIIYRWL